MLSHGTSVPYKGIPVTLVRKETWENEGTWEEEERGGRGTKRKTGEEGGRGLGLALSSRPVQSHVPPDPECEQATSYTYFWYRKTLKASDRIEDGGQPSFSLGMSLFLSFCLICAFLVNGIKSIGKVSCTWPLAFSSATTLFSPSWPVIPKSFFSESSSSPLSSTKLSRLTSS